MIKYFYSYISKIIYICNIKNYKRNMKCQKKFKLINIYKNVSLSISMISEYII